MSALSKEEILQGAGMFKTVELEVADLGGSVFIREVSAKEYDRIQSLCGRIGAGEHVKLFRAECCAYFLSDADGKRLFGDNQFELLGRLNAGPIDAIMQAGFKLNRLADSDVVEQEVKNSETAQ